jgi:hypothetical protein
LNFKLTHIHSSYRGGTTEVLAWELLDEEAPETVVVSVLDAVANPHPQQVLQLEPPCHQSFLILSPLDNLSFGVSSGGIVCSHFEGLGVARNKNLLGLL